MMKESAGTKEDLNKAATTRKRRTGQGFFSPLLTLKPRNNKYNVTKHKHHENLPTSAAANPYNHQPFPSVAPFHRDEIVTGACLSFSTSSSATNNNFQYYNVCGIQIHQPSDTTEAMGDFSSSSRHDEDHDGIMALHHRQFPPIPSAASDDEEAREVIQAQTLLPTGNKAQKPLHKYMLKQVDTKCLHQDEAIVHLVHETKLWKKLSHQHYNLLTLRGTTFGGDNLFASQWDSYFLLTDRISETLAQRIERWRENGQQQQQQHTLWAMTKQTAIKIPRSQVDTSSLEFRLKLVYAENLANVLAFLQSKKIAVRNLTPESIGFLASDDTLQLMDLGQAMEQLDTIGHRDGNTTSSSETMLQQQHEHPLFLLTPGGQPFRYMAPELLTTIHHVKEEATPTCGTKVDSYSWAMICFEMLTLHKPFGKMRAGRHLTKVCLRQPSIRPHLEVYQLPEAMERLLKRAWRQEPTQRLDAKDIDKRMKRLLQDQLFR